MTNQTNEQAPVQLTEEQVFIQATDQAKFYKGYKNLVHALGIEEGFFLSYVIDTYFAYRKYNKLYKGEWIPFKLEKIQERTLLGEKAQNTRLKALEKKGFIQISKLSYNNKRHVKLEMPLITSLLMDETKAMAFKEAIKTQKSKKAAHLEPGPKPKKAAIVAAENLPSGETITPPVGESTSSKLEGPVSPERRDIQDFPKQGSLGNTQNHNNYNPLNITNPVSISGEQEPVDNSKDYEGDSDTDILKFVKELKAKFPAFPEELYDLLTSRVSRAYEFRKDKYDLFNQYYYVFPSFYFKHKDEITMQAFVELFTGFFAAEEEITVVKGYLETKLKLHLGETDSKFGDNKLYRPQFNKQVAQEVQEGEFVSNDTETVAYTPSQITQFKINLSTYSGFFPWIHYNQITGYSLSQEEIDAKRRSWEVFKSQLALERDRLYA